MNSKSIPLAALAVAVATTAQAAVPRVSNTQMAQAANRLVTITYTLTDAPAVVTLDIETNVTGTAEWASIGGEALWNAKGDVWRKVGNDLAIGQTFSGTIHWRPDLSWPDHKIADGGARAVLTAWALDNTPDYMVVDLAAANTVRYYPGVDFLPGSTPGQKGTVTNNPAYKTSKLLMRKIMAAGVEWTMGSADGEPNRDATLETPHVATLSNNYYIGVFEVTQAQWSNIATNNRAEVHYTVDGAMRPMEGCCFNHIRIRTNTAKYNASDPEIANFTWPNSPAPLSFLGMLRSKTGVDFDLPSESQWEFACRAGNGSGFWNNGSAIKNNGTSADENLDKLGRYANGAVSNNESQGPYYNGNANGTAIVGTYEPNDWGLYDMHGNVFEICLDWFEANIATATDASGKLYGGRVNIDPSNPSCYLSGASVSGEGQHVIRGGSWYYSADKNRPAYRRAVDPRTRNNHTGFRLVCTAGLR